MDNHLVLVSHALCPYVQRVAITPVEKGVAFERVYVDLSDKPAWFQRVSPLGKTPVLQVDGEPVFESAVICEYLEETTLPRLHPENALERARHRGWIEFGSAVLGEIAGFYNAPDAAALQAKAAALHSRFERIEEALGGGPFFAGPRFSLVDAAFAPVFRYFDVFEAITDFRFFETTPRVRAWRAALALRPSVRDACLPTYPQLLELFLRRRGSALAGLIARRDTAA